MLHLGDDSVMTTMNTLTQKERSATLCLDQSTIEQSVSKDVALAMRAVGADMVDAPVSGGMTDYSIESLGELNWI
jgi:3-hydroxyisobutyrate dehydrogenase